MIEKLHPNSAFIRDGWFDIKGKLDVIEGGYNVNFKLNRCPSIHKIFLKYTDVLGIATIKVKNKTIGEITSSGELEISGLSCGDNSIQILGNAEFNGCLIIECVPNLCIKAAKFIRNGNKLNIYINTSVDGEVKIDIIGDGTYVAKTNNCTINEEIECVTTGRIEYVLHFNYDVVVGYCE